MAEDISEQRQFAEDVGQFFGTFGLPRMAGRILGWLLICDPPRQSGGDLAQALGASKGSISTATRLLESYALIERVAVPGERGDFFELREAAFSQANEQMGTYRVFRELMERGLALIDEGDSRRTRRLRRTRDFYAFMEDEFPKLVTRFEEEYGPE